MEQELRKLREIANELMRLRDEYEDRRNTQALDAMIALCASARRVTDRRYGNVLEQIGRVEAGIKRAMRSDSSDLYQAVTRVDAAVGIHERHPS